MNITKINQIINKTVHSYVFTKQKLTTAVLIVGTHIIL